MKNENNIINIEVKYMKNEIFYNPCSSTKFNEFIIFVISKLLNKVKTYIIKDIKVENNDTISITTIPKYGIRKRKTTNIDLRVFYLYFQNINSQLDKILNKDKIDSNELSDCLKNKKIITIQYILTKGGVDTYPSGWTQEIIESKELIKIVEIKD